MSALQLALYKGPPTGDLWHLIAHRFTCLWTRSLYSHVELVLDAPDAQGLSLCASSSARDGGVRFKRIDLDSGRWDVVPMPQVDVVARTHARAWFYGQVGRPYDWLGLLWFVLPVKAFNNPRRWFCSEAVAAAMGLPKPHKFHPQRLLDALKKGPP